MAMELPGRIYAFVSTKLGVWQSSDSMPPSDFHPGKYIYTIMY